MASTIIATGREKAQKSNWSVSIVVVDDGDHPPALNCIDDYVPITAHISQERAYTTMLGHHETKGYEKTMNSGRTAFVITPLLASLGGGVPAVVNGQIIGAVNASSLTGAQDTQITKAATTVLTKQAKTRRQTIGQTITQGRLRIDANFKRFTSEKVLPRVGPDAAAFWRNFDEIVHDLTPENRRSLAEHNHIQVAPDERHRSNPGPVKDKATYKSLLRELDYLVPQPKRMTTGTTGIGSEIISQAESQLVVPAMNTRHALSAANAYQGSPYDTLYDSNIIPQEGAVINDYDSQRGEQVII